MDNLIFNVTDEFIGERIDKYLSMQIQGKSRSFIQGLITDKKIHINGSEVKSNYKLRKNDIINVILPEPIELNVTAEKIDINIIYEDEDVVVVNKEKGMVVHPAPGNYKGTLVNALLYHCGDLSGINGVIRPGIVHRIDKDTSGIVIFAKNEYIQECLIKQMKNKQFIKKYIAIVNGNLDNLEGIINAPIARKENSIIERCVSETGDTAITHYKVLKRNDNFDVIECILETGRTHQIRVHFAYLGHSLLSDTLYGVSSPLINRQALHAYEVEFIHPITKQKVKYIADIPDDFKNILKKT